MQSSRLKKNIYTAIVVQSYPPTKTTGLRPIFELILKKNRHQTNNAL